MLPLSQSLFHPHAASLLMLGVAAALLAATLVVAAALTVV